MMQRLRQLDETVFEPGGTLPARLVAVAIGVGTSVLFMLIISVLRDGQKPSDWLTIVPALVVIVLATRVFARAPRPIVYRAILAAVLFWIAAKFGMSESLAAPIAMVLAAAAIFRTGLTLKR